MKLSLKEPFYRYLRQPFLIPSGHFVTPADDHFVQQLRQLDGATVQLDIVRCLGGVSDDGGRVWFWSDHHFFHNEILGFSGRPFVSLHAMHSAFVRAACERVKPNDILIFGGDVCWENVSATNDFLRQMPGRKILVLGNHDIESSGHVKDLAFNDIVPFLEFEAYGYDVFVSHHPVSEDLLSRPNQRNLHGHMHHKALPIALGTGDKHINFSVEETAYAPVQLLSILR